MRTPILLLLVLSILFVGCSPINDSRPGQQVTGTDGITMRFVEGSPRPSYVVTDIREPILFLVEIQNKGAFPQENEGQGFLSRGFVYLSGYDRGIVDMFQSQEALSQVYLPGVSIANELGSVDVIEFEGEIDPNGLANTYDAQVIATACYPYRTRTSPTVCIDPNPFDETRQKVCTPGTINLGSQGAPVAITQIEQTAATNQHLFKFTVENVGGGDVLKYSSIDSCGPLTSLGRDDFDRIVITNVRVGESDITENCKPLENNAHVRMFDGRATFVCSLNRDEYRLNANAYTTPLFVELEYGYRQTIGTSIAIQRATGAI